ncbi:MAG: hypothetical protein ACLPYY_02575 [Acidimicrobiales bacterium]
MILASLCLFGLLLRTVSSGVNNGYGNLINDIGVLVAFYYGATGLACAWAFRKVSEWVGEYVHIGTMCPGGSPFGGGLW